MLIFQLLALAGLLAGLYGIYLRYAQTKRRALPVDKSPLKGNPQHGITYAFTKGMMPWAKESTRLHMIAYLRGIGFHIGIFTALGALLISPFWTLLPSLLSWTLGGVLTLGAILGAAGGLMRLAEHNLRGLSLPDDHFAVWLVTVWMAASAIAVWNEAWMAAYYLLSAITMAYVPLGKIRHCLYFFFSRTFFGKFFGRRAVYPHPEPVVMDAVVLHPVRSTTADERGR
ncbi:MAG: hypothetical protein HY867_05290 [Chloroflexi bacterium]|nr:hypothetical protein [Chloroflexota bacterium]